VIQIAVGAGVFAPCVAMHACFMLWSVRVIGPRLQKGSTSFDLVSTMVATVGLLNGLLIPWWKAGHVRELIERLTFSVHRAVHFGRH
jgi:nitrate reductase gamma subunit